MSVRGDNPKIGPVFQLRTVWKMWRAMPSKDRTWRMLRVLVMGVVRDPWRPRWRTNGVVSAREAIERQKAKEDR